jgi:hypothetical protein
MQKVLIMKIMMEVLIMADTIISCIIYIIFFVLGYLVNKVSDLKIYADGINKRISCVYKIASSFIAYADQFMKESTGEKKMQFVVDKVLEILEDNCMTEFDDDTVKAIAQKAYVAFKAGKNGNIN